MFGPPLPDWTTTPLYLIDVFDELVDVLEVLVCIFKLEVGAKGQHDLRGLVMYPLVCHSTKELLDTQLHIVVKEIRIILQAKYGEKVDRKCEAYFSQAHTNSYTLFPLPTPIAFLKDAYKTIMYKQLTMQQNT